MSQTIETTTSVTVIHGAALSFESIGATSAADAPLRLRQHHETLLRVVEGTIVLAVDGRERTLGIEDEARIPADTPHRIHSVDRARVVQELRRR